MQIIRSRRKTIALIVNLEGELLVRAPLRTSQQQIEALLAQKQAWIQQKQALARQQAEQYRPKTIRAGETFLWLGKRYPLEVIDSAPSALALKEGRFWLRRAALSRASLAFEGWYRLQARRYLGERVQDLAEKHGFRPGRLRISSAVTRWGSCSSKGTLSFPWRLVMAPPAVIDYVIIHELCHLKERNHGPRFWALVAALVPDYQSLRGWLNENGRTLAV